MIETQGEIQQPIQGNTRSMDEIEKLDLKMSEQRSGEIKSATPSGSNQWSAYPQTELASPSSAQRS